MARPPRTNPPDGLATLVRCRALLLRNIVDQQLREAPWRVLMMLGLLVLIWGALYLLLETIFRQIRHWGLISAVADQHVFVYFFLVLAVMLAFSNAILTFGALFGRDEAAHLLSLPVAPRHVVCVKWFEGMFLSSWSFLLLGVPLMSAVASTARVEWYFFPLFIAHFLGFVTIPATVGTLAAWAVAMWAPRRPLPTAVWIGSVLLLVAVFWLSNVYREAAMTEQWLRTVFEKIAVARTPLLPSTWSARGVVAAIERRIGDSCFYLVVVAANSLWLGWAVINLVGASWPEAYSRARQGRYRPTIRRGWLTQLLTWAFFFYLPRRSRLLVLKDVRTFVRDATQWTQIVIMLGLLAIYVINLPQLPVDLGDANVKGLIAFLNLTTVSLIMATFTSRFVFPMVSLEGQQLWLVHMLPIQRAAVLRAKFLSALTISVASAAGVMALAAYVLELPAVWAGMHLVVTLSLCAGLCGLAVGLGARFPVLGQRNAARIASGFGGTLNLIASMVFVLTVMAGVALVSLGEIQRTGGMNPDLSPRSWLLIGATIALSAAAAGVPMRVGGRHFARLEA